MLFLLNALDNVQVFSFSGKERNNILAEEWLFCWYINKM
jgi:hypothetical protein